MNIIFLDMDGVINNSSFIDNWIKENGNSNESIKKFKDKYCLNDIGFFILPELLNRFNNMYNKIHDCKIVWSSSWRNFSGRNSKLFVEGFFYQCGFPKGSFLSYTPSLRNNFRSEEILQWIHTFKSSFQIDKCAIIDDLKEADPMIDEYLGIKLKFFKTEMKEGLTKKIAKDIIAFFKNDK